MFVSIAAYKTCSMLLLLQVMHKVQQRQHVLLHQVVQDISQQLSGFEFNLE
jgi:hypothetical protein